MRFSRLWPEPAYPISRHCPSCGERRYRAIPGASFGPDSDRCCTGCGTRYIPQSSLLACLILVPAGLLAVLVGCGLDFFGLWLLTIGGARVPEQLTASLATLLMGTTLILIGCKITIARLRTLRASSGARGFPVLPTGAAPQRAVCATSDADESKALEGRREVP
jgi:hypothetical protein